MQPTVDDVLPGKATARKEVNSAIAFSTLTLHDRLSISDGSIFHWSSILKKLCALVICSTILCSSSGCLWLAEQVICNALDDDPNPGEMTDADRREKFERDFLRERDYEEQLRRRREGIIHPTYGDWRDSLPPGTAQ